jgi:hypothetical protein
MTPSTTTTKRFILMAVFADGVTTNMGFGKCSFDTEAEANDKAAELLADETIQSLFDLNSIATIDTLVLSDPAAQMAAEANQYDDGR